MCAISKQYLIKKTEELTADPTQVPTDNTESVPNFVSRFAQRIKAILGTTNWWDAIPITLTAAKAHVDSLTNPHNVTAAQAGALQSVDGVRNDGGDVDFEAGANMTITPNDSLNKVTFSASGVLGYGTVQEEGSDLVARSKLNFSGPGVTASDNAGATRTDVVVSGVATVQEEGSPVTQRGVVNFTGDAVTVSDNVGATRTDVSIPAGQFYVAQTEVSLSGATTLTGTAFFKMHVLSGATNYAVVLPTAVGNAGKTISFRVADSAAALITLDGNGSETINGALTRFLWSGESCVLLSDGVGWVKIAGTVRPMKAAVRQTSGGQSIAYNTITVLDMNTVEFDLGSMTNTTNDTITIRRPGIYRVSGYVMFEASMTRTVWLARLNSTTHVVYAEGTVAGGFGWAGAQKARSYAAGDVLEGCAYHTNASSAARITYSGAEGLLANFSVVEEPQW